MNKFDEMIGKQFGTLIPEYHLLKGKSNRYFHCKCIVCSQEKDIYSCSLENLLKTGKDGCKHTIQVTPGNTYGFWTVINQTDDYIKPKSGQREPQYICKCKCGNIKTISKDNLISGKSTSCGCFAKELRISLPEKVIFYYFKKIFNEVIDNYMPKWLNKSEIDIFIPSINIGIEYDGERWHKDVNKDLRKNQICKDHGIQLIRVREPQCPPIDIDYVVHTKRPLSNALHMTEVIKEIAFLLGNITGTKYSVSVDIIHDLPEILDLWQHNIKNKSLATLFPEIAREWHPTKNGNLSPEEIYPHVGYKVWWQCENGHEFHTVVSSRTGDNKIGCPYCSGRKLLSGHNDLQTVFPEIAEEFCEELNGISPTNVHAYSNSIFWFKCKSCNHIWKSKITNRTSTNRQGCPNCSRKKSAASRKITLAEKNGSLSEKYPELMADWDYSKNTIDPAKITSGSRDFAFWKCSRCGFEWENRIINVAIKHAICPKCSYKKRNQAVKCVETGMIFNSVKEAADYCNGNVESIRACINGRYKTSAGYHWEKYNQSN